MIILFGPHLTFVAKDLCNEGSADDSNELTTPIYLPRVTSTGAPDGLTWKERPIYHMSANITTDMTTKVVFQFPNITVTSTNPVANGVAIITTTEPVQQKNSFVPTLLILGVIGIVVVVLVVIGFVLVRYRRNQMTKNRETKNFELVSIE